MEAFKLDLYEDYYEHRLIDLAGTRTYKNRMVQYSEDWLDDSIYELRKRIEKGKGSARIHRALITAATREAAYSKEYIGYETSRYYEVLPSIWVDRFNTLELCGSMEASKQSTILYSFHDKLHNVLAYLFDADPDMVKERLIRNCSRYNVDYEVLSYAFCTMDCDMIKSINLQALVGVCELLDLLIYEVFWYPDNCIYTVGDTVVNISDVAFTPEERITTYLITNIAFTQQALLNQIIGFFKQDIEPFQSSRNCMLCSKGFGNVAITAKDTSVFPEIPVTLGENNEFVLKPLTYLEIGG